jgi:hypothetical protein
MLLFVKSAAKQIHYLFQCNTSKYLQNPPEHLATPVRPHFSRKSPEKKASSREEKKSARHPPRKETPLTIRFETIPVNKLGATHIKIIEAMRRGPGVSKRRLGGLNLVVSLKTRRFLLGADLGVFGLIIIILFFIMLLLFDCDLLGPRVPLLGRGQGGLGLQKG